MNEFQSTPVITDERIPRLTQPPAVALMFQSTPVITDERILRGDNASPDRTRVSIHARHY